MKKSIAIILSFVMMFSVFSFVASAQSSVNDVQAKVDALSHFPSVNSVEQQEYQAVFAQTKETVVALACLSEQEMAMVQDYEKAFQMYIDLVLLQAKALIPTEETTIENYMEHRFALEAVCDILFNEEPLYLLAEYTYVTQSDIYDYSSVTQTGFVSLYQVQDEYFKAVERCGAFWEQATSYEEFLFLHEKFNRVLATFPENFTQENTLAYANDFLALIYQTEGFDGDYYWVRDVFTESGERYNQLREEFEIIMGIYGDCYTEEVDAQIGELLHVEAAKDYSDLRVQFLEWPLYQDITGKITAIEFINGNRIYENLSNLDTLLAYETVFWSESLPYGDLDGDYEVTAKDALVVLKAAVEKITLNGARFTTGDLDNDGSITAKDALLILQYAVGKIYYFPVEMELYGIV